MYKRQVEKKGVKWYRKVAEPSDSFMVRWHLDDAESSWVRQAPENASRDDKEI